MYIYIYIYNIMILNVYEFNLLRLSYSIYLPAPSPLWILSPSFKDSVDNNSPLSATQNSKADVMVTIPAPHVMVRHVIGPVPHLKLNKTDQTWAFSKQSGLLVFYI